MVERINTLLGSGQRLQRLQRQLKSHYPVEIFQREIASQFAEQLLLAEWHDQGNGQSIMLVVDELEENIDKELKRSRRWRR